ncbi:MAG: hypothetical protein OXK82_12170 [Deltaproteobacteria bacterium]|nr:hypothetical protein [Deltaproteobacteria bacterium]
MVRILLLVALLSLAVGCGRVLESIPGHEKLSSGVIVDSAEGSVTIEAAWTVGSKTIRSKAEEGCEAQSSGQAKKKATDEISRSCGKYICLTTLHLFYCKTDSELKELKKMGVKVSS